MSPTEITDSQTTSLDTQTFPSEDLEAKLPSSLPESKYPAWSDDPENPLNWPRKRKWKVCLTVSITGFISTLGSSIAAPSAAQISDKLGSPGDGRKVQALLTVCYVIGLGFVSSLCLQR